MKNSIFFLFLFFSNSSSSAEVVLPFHNVNGYIMISGSVNEQHGLFMFDTGTPFDFLLNNNKNTLANNEFIAAGAAGSGQPISIFRQNKSVLINLFYGAINLEHFSTMHADLEFIQKGVSPNFTGMIGSEFLKKPFSIDYKSQTVTIYDTLPPIGSEYIKLSTKGSPLPEMQLTIGDVNMTGYFDTGNLGTLTLNKETESTLIESKNLTLESRNALNGEPGHFNVANLTGVRYNENNFGAIEELRYELGGDNRIGLGYSFLKEYRSIWDLANDTLYLLPNK